MAVLEFKWKLPGNVFKNQDIKDKITKQISERIIATLKNKNTLASFVNNQFFVVSFPNDNLSNSLIMTCYTEIENLLSFHNLTPFIRLNRNVGTTWDIFD